MKKIFALLMALCLICVSAAALAEATAADGSPVKLDGFTLNLEAGAYSPSRIILKPLMVSSMLTITPGTPVNC